MMDDIYVSFVRMVFVLAGVLALLALLYRFLTKYKMKFSAGDRGYGLRKVDTISLGYKKFLSIVEVKDEILLIGVGQNEMSLLRKWKKEPERT